MRSLYIAVFLLILAVSIMGMVYAGIQKDKHDIEKYNLSNTPEVKKKEENPLIGKWCGSIFISALIIYLVLGFVCHLWSIGWIVFPICFLMCGIASIIISKDAKG